MKRTIRPLLFAFIFSFFLLPTQTRAATYTAKSCSESDVQNAFNQEQANPADGDIIQIPAGDCTWTGNVGISHITLNNSLTIEGAGARYAVGGGASTITGSDQTIIKDDLTHNGANPPSNPLFWLTTAAGKSLRITGFAIIYDPANTTYDGHGDIVINGSSTSVRIDHMHFENLKEMTVAISGALGVIDHCYVQFPANVVYFGFSFAYTYSGSASGDPYGDKSFADPDNFGSSDAFYMENNVFVEAPGTNDNSFGNDCWGGARFVARYNYFENVQLQTHISGRSRPCREWEIYNNTFTQDSNSNALPDAFFVTAGTGFVFNNTVTGAIPRLLLATMDQTGQAFHGYPYGTAPTHWGYCGTLWLKGTVSTDGTSVTWLSGPKFSTSWLTRTPIVINGTDYQISSVNSPISITLVQNAGTQAAVPYETGSPWNGNTDDTGYPCLDAIGRGQGDLLSSEPFPKVVDTVTGTITWPHQKLDPVYAWSNSIEANSGKKIIIANPLTAPVFQENRDYYVQEPDVTFNGTAGVGCGPNTTATCPQPVPKPSTCTPQVGYWDNSANNGQGELDVCTATNQWSPYYTPYPYPDPLDANTTPQNLRTTSVK